MRTEAIAAPREPVAGGTAYGRIVGLGLGELARSLSGFLILIACIALGVAVIAGIGSLSDALRAGFERQGKVLLGGDVTLARPHRRATDPERAWMTQQGRLSETATLRSMARRLDGAEQVLVEVKGVDDAYPLAGEVRLAGDADLRQALAGLGAIVEPILLERLGLKVGDRLQLGRSQIEIRALLAGEPDKIADRFTVGPRVLVSLATLAASGLAEPGGLVRWRYAMDLPPAPGNEALDAFRARVKADLPESGFGVTDRSNPSPSLSRTLDQLRQFLTLIGLAALIIGGVGVANAMASYVDRRRKVIATMRSLGASGRQIFTLHLVQVLALAAIGIAIGLTLGLLIPPAVDRAIAGVLPVRAEVTVSAGTMALAAGYGLLVALLFSLWPLGRAAEIRAAALFRDEVAPESRWPAWPVVAATLAIGLTLAGLAVATSESRAVALYFWLGVAVVLVVFPWLGSAVAWTARHIPRPKRPEIALALGSIGAPGGLTRSVVLSLGTGLSLLSAVTLIDTSIVRELQTRLPANSPDYFLLDIPTEELASLRTLITRRSAQAELHEAPMLRGRLVALEGRPADQIKAPPEAQWVLRGDRGLSYAETVPEGSKVVAGAWWPAGYQGEPLVSFEAELAHHLKLSVGDQVTVNVLGRNVTARIANLREVHWENLGINFVMVFSPNVLQAAPHNLLATVSLPSSFTLAEEAQLSRDIGKAHPAVTVIRVKDAIDAFNVVLGKIMTAVRVAGSVTLLAGALVLAGALATAQRRRIKLAVILKALGGTRRQILTMHLAEYLVLALATAGIAMLVGAAGAWAATTFLLKVQFSFSLAAVLQSLLVAIVLVVAFGLAGTWQVLRAPPVPYLRSEGA
ncbi:MAG: FtsX-like permease family protein [Hyphomicrobiaceae bacterium]|nr:FtsX-like permease family protein [Hyphomicrobiaceae bacterium]